jgi:glycosyltransferase involved in cell wall biosynthesis
MTNWRARWGRLGTHVVANSEATREHLIRVLRVRPEHITVILDAPKFMTVPSRADIERVRAEFGYAPDQPVLICLGRLTDEKGHAVLLQALARIRREFPRVRLLIVGKGHLRRELEKLTRALRLDDIVTFTGYRDDVSALLSAATVAVHPSLTDAAPFTNIECLRFGVPVISTEVGGISEVIRDGETGILVPRNDVPALAEAVCRALRDPKALRALTERGQLEVAARFSPAVMCQRYEDYFAAVLRRTLRSGLDAVAGISGCEPAQRIGGT